ncbi:MAG: beta-galactosidase [Bacteroidales bacterium]|nr:beta-galactosidase [Bacteroidales bacterium]
MKTTPHSILLLQILLFAGLAVHAQDIDHTISLHGTWNFRIDSLDAGIEEQWFSKEFDQQIQLPGSMAENGLGDEVSLATEWTGSIVDRSYFTEDRYEKYRTPGNIKLPFWLKPDTYYVGPAWYQKEVEVPEKWDGKRIFLHLERCHWESTVFVNDKDAGNRNSLSAPHEYDITSMVKPGTNRISIRIDNQMIIPVGVNSHSVSDHTQSNWNGMVGFISLEARSQVHITNIQVFPDLSKNMARLQIQMENPSESLFEGTLELEAASFNSDRSHQPGKITRKISLTGQSQLMEVEYPMGPDALLWDEFSPALYHLNATLKKSDGSVMDQASEQFGMREFKAVGTRFAVNGHPVFLRGTLECCIFPLTGYPPTDDAYWEHLMNQCEAHGLNHIRFHSWCPPEAAFRVADRLGMYLQVECGSWANQGSTIGSGSPLDQYIYQEGDRILEAYGNHPSFCMMAYGNEPAGDNMNTYLVKLMDSWRAKDSRRVYTAGAGWPILPENDYHNGPEPRIQQWGAGLNSIINAQPPQTSYDFARVISKYHIPYVSHEIGQWCVYPDFGEINKYTGVLKPTNFEIFKETLEENHMGKQAADFLMASGKLQALCYKAEVEAALRTPGFAGFQLLQLHDFPGQGTALVGILDPFFDSKGYISPYEFRQFCNTTVPLARMDQRIYTSNDTFTAAIELSHFGSSPLRNQKIICRIVDAADKTVHEEVLEKPVIPVNNAIYIGEVDYPLKDISQAGKYRLEISVEGTPYRNSWDFWVYPEKPVPDPKGVWITNELDKKAIKKLSKGGSVLLLANGKVNKTHGAKVAIGFSSIFWNTAWTGGQAPHTLGILCDPEHSVFQDFPTEYHSNWQWWDPVTRSQVMILDHMPAELNPLIQPIDTWFENRRLGLLFEARVNGGNLMVCSIDLINDLESRPVSQQLLHSTLEYMNSPEFHPETEIESELIRELF